MQNLSHTDFSLKGGSGSVTGLNGGNNNIYVSNQTTLPDNFIFEQVDPSQDDDDSDSDTTAFGQVNQGLGFQPNTTNSGLKAGKKTKGRVKIKMEFIENKLRRYTTFSKRKTGIMKKAYELSTLTGTQVMLLVASETGHVYTFATRKLQPMITSDSGKALIQTCLNSPDPPPGTPSGNVLEQRMKPCGFEETDLSCVVGDDEQPRVVDTSTNLKPVFPNLTQEQIVTPMLREVIPTSTVTQMVSQVPTFSIQTTSGTFGKDTPVFSVSTKPVTINSNNATANNVSAASNLTMQIPLIFPQAISMLQAGGQPITVTQSAQSSNVLKSTTLSQMVSAINNQAMSNNQSSNMGELNTPLPASTPSAINIMQGMTPGIVMYHTPQGVVYATPTQNIHDRTIFNFPQPATTISMSQADHSTGQQIITFPVPVSLSSTPLLQLATSIENPADSAQVVQQPPSKKSKK